MKRLFALALPFLCPTLWSNTNLGTILTIEKGLATVKECQKEEIKSGPCLPDPLEGLRDILNFATTNQCLAGAASLKNAGIEVPECPDGFDDLKGLDNTYPSSGIFAIYAAGYNRNFLYDLASNYLKNNPVGRFNLVLPMNLNSEVDMDIASILREDEELLEILNSPRVNIINVATMPAVFLWMQDAFQFTTLGNKPAIYQVSQPDEAELPLANRLACQVAKQCDLPYFVPSDLVDLTIEERFDSVNSGGNLETLPGGTFIMGTRGNELELTEVQETYKKSLEQSGNKVLKFDTGFLFVSHMDEIINVVKTDQPAPCNYAVMLASPDKAFELMEQTVENPEYPFSSKKSESESERPLASEEMPATEEMPKGGKKHFISNGCELRCPYDDSSKIGFQCSQFCPYPLEIDKGDIGFLAGYGHEGGRLFNNDAGNDAGIEYDLGRCVLRCLKETGQCFRYCENSDTRCDTYSFLQLMNSAVQQGKKFNFPTVDFDIFDPKIIKNDKVSEIYNNYCINGVPLESYITSESYQIIKQQKTYEKDIRQTMKKNKNKLIEELKSSTKCSDPPIIEMPVFFRSGTSYLPNVVNGIVETPANGKASHTILPRTYFRPFDDYIKDELKKYGVGVTLIHDLEYHLGGGEVHCGTNEARICK